MNNQRRANTGDQLTTCVGFVNMSDERSFRYKNRKEDNKRFLLEFIQTYRALPALWDARCREYYKRKKKAKQYDILLQKYRERYPDAEKVHMTKKINILRTNFRREMKRLEACSKFGEEYDSSRESSVWYYEELSFIKDSFYTICRPEELRHLHHIKEPLKAHKFNKDFQKQSIIADERTYAIEIHPISSDESDTLSNEQLEDESITKTSLQSNRDKRAILERIDRKPPLDQIRSCTRSMQDFTSYKDDEDHKVKEAYIYNRLIKSEVSTENYQQSSNSATDLEVSQSCRPRSLREQCNELPTLQAKDRIDHDEQCSRPSLNAYSESSDEFNAATVCLVEDKLACKRSKTQIKPSSELDSLVSQQLKQQTDHLKMMTEVWALKLRRMNTTQQLYAEKFINDLLFEGLLGNLTRNSVQITH